MFKMSLDLRTIPYKKRWEREEGRREKEGEGRGGEERGGKGKEGKEIEEKKVAKTSVPGHTFWFPEFLHVE